MQTFNTEALEEIIQRYSDQMEAIRRDEVYKWEATYCFQQHWNPNAENFAEMLKASLGKPNNLLLGAMYFPMGMITIYAEQDPSATRRAFSELFDESRPLRSRLEDFTTAINTIHEDFNAKQAEAGEKPAANTYQDARAMSVYLAYAHPDINYLYKAEMYRRFAKRIEAEVPGNKFDKVISYKELCDQVLAYLEQNHAELIEASDNLLAPEYRDIDPKHHLLVQDIIYFATSYDWRENEWWPSTEEYTPGLSVEDWEQLLRDNTVFTDESLEIMKRFMDCGGAASCSELAGKYGKTKNFYNNGSRYLAQRVAEKTGCPTLDIENSKWWPVLYQGRYVDVSQRGEYAWRVRDELVEALEHMDLSHIPLHAGEEASIDGADRKYWWLVANPKIWSFSDIEIGDEQSYTLRNENGNPRRIQKHFLEAKPGDLVYGYESSPTLKVVALCEISKEHDDERMYFRKVRDLQEPISYKELQENEALSNLEFMLNYSGSLFAVTPEEHEVLQSMIGEEDVPIERKEFPAYTDQDFLAEVFLRQEDLSEMKELLRRKKNLILQGAPGTGKTFAAKRLAYAMMGAADTSRVQMVQFHQNSAYDDFVYGYRPNDAGGFDVVPGTFVEFCRKAVARPAEEFFFVIDEINRANISKVLGELLMLIEADHREESITLPVSGERFAVPGNLYIIGMMNTADRGLALIDYALRRRFAFFEMEPALTHQKFREAAAKGGDGVESLVDAVIGLNETIAADPALGRGFRIGHSYFCVGDNASADIAESIIKYELRPLIEEYWFDNPTKAEGEIGKLEDAVR